MKKMVVFMLFAFFALAFSAYNVGEIVGDESWMDNNGEAHSISELTASGKVVVFFWGSSS